MIIYTYETKIDYSYTDAMGFMHHSNYARLYENARWELLRSLGLPYSKIEELGYWMPVIGMNLKYHKPAFYDNSVQIEVKIKRIPSVKMPVYYKMYNV